MKFMKPAVLMMLALVCVLTGCQNRNKKTEYFITGDLSGKKIGIVENLVSEKKVKEKIQGARVISYKSVDDAVNALKSKKIKALVLDALHSKPVLEKDNSLAAMLENLETVQYVIPTLFDGDSDQNDFTLEVDATITKLRGIGQYDALIAKYFGTQNPDTSNLVYNKGTTGRVLTVGVNADNKPFAYKDASGKIVGFNVEIANAIAKTWGADLVFKEYPQDKLLDAVNNKEIKIAIDCITKPAKEYNHILFSGPYFDASQYIILNEIDVGKNPLAK